jgi:hypothetical protein
MHGGPMSKNGNKNVKPNAQKDSKPAINWSQVLFAGFALLIVVSMILSAFM